MQKSFRKRGNPTGKSSNSLRVRLIRSGIGRPSKQRKVLKGLNLNRLNKTVTLKDTPEIRGMIEKVSHLVEIVEG